MTAIQKKWIIEIIWWGITVALTALVLLPIFSSNIDFPWMTYNIIYLLGGLTLSRYIFSLDHHPLSHSRIFKVLMIFTAPILFFPILEGLHSFLEFNDQEGMQSILTDLSPERQRWFMRYIRIEYVFAGMTCFLGVFAIIIKMIRSLWRQYRRL